MSFTPRIHLTAWEDRQNDFIFVAVPNERGRYLRTDKSVVIRGCPFCGSVVGEPCKAAQGYGGTTHYHRRRGYGRDELAQACDYPAMPDPVPAEWMGDAS